MNVPVQHEMVESQEKNHWIMKSPSTGKSPEDSASPEGASAPPGDVANPYDEESFTESLDRYHGILNSRFYETVVHMNGWFVREGATPEKVPPPRLLVGLFGRTTMDPGNKITGEFLSELDASIKLPDMEQFKLFITNKDPRELPGSTLDNKDTSPRFGIDHEWYKYLGPAVGIKLRSIPVLYANLTVGTRWGIQPWRFYPQYKAYWEHNSGPGMITSFVADRYQNMWDTRMTASVKWSREKMKDDDAEGNDENGLQWQSGFLLAYVRELLVEPDLGRIISGADYGQAVGARLVFIGNPGSTDAVRFLLFRKGRFLHPWLYYYIVPEIEWSRQDDWGRSLRMTMGFEAVFSSDDKTTE
jgi:hypothetical protein